MTSTRTLWPHVLSGGGWGHVSLPLCSVIKKNKIRERQSREREMLEELRTRSGGRLRRVEVRRRRRLVG